MTHPRNVEGIRQNAQQKHQQAVQRAEEAIRRLLNQKRSVNFKAVAEAAGVSIPFLYQNQILKERIIHLRKQSAVPVSLKGKQCLTDASKESIIETLRLRIKTAESENQTLKQQLEVVYGQLLQSQQTPSIRPKFEEMEQGLRQTLAEKAELEEKNRELKNRNDELSNKIREFEGIETELERLRAQNQGLLNEIGTLTIRNPVKANTKSGRRKKTDHAQSS